MPTCGPPSVNSGSKNGVLRNAKPERVDNPITNLSGEPPPLPPSSPRGAYHRPSRSRRSKLPVPPSGPPDCDTPTEVYVPAVANGRAMRGARVRLPPSAGRRQFWQLNAALNRVLVAAPENDWSSKP